MLRPSLRLFSSNENKETEQLPTQDGQLQEVSCPKETKKSETDSSESVGENTTPEPETAQETNDVTENPLPIADVTVDEEPVCESVPPQTETITNKREDENITEIKELLRQLAKDFEVKLKYDVTKQGQIDKLYEENQNFKEGILKKFQRSLILAVIEKIDEAEKSIAFFDGEEFTEANYRKLLAFYRDTATDFQDVLLQKFDVSVFRCEPNSPFDAKRQRSLKTTPTDNTELHKSVKQSLRPGYEIDGKVLRPEFVEVYVKQ